MKRFNNSSNASCQQQKSEKREGWDVINRNFWSDKNLSASDCRVMGYLHSNDEDFHPSLKAIAKMVHMSIKTVWKSIKNLIKCGYLLARLKKGSKTIYKSTGKISTTVVKSTTPTVVKNTTHRNSNKEKAIYIHDVVDTKHEPDKPKPATSSKKALGFELARAIHGQKGYNFAKANNLYAKLLDKYGVQTLYQPMKRFIAGFLQGRTVKFSKVEQVINEIPHIIEKYSDANNAC
jgi:biotin operon repressor